METPEQRRDAFLAALAEAGGIVLEVVPLGHPDAPTVVAAYQVLPGYPDPSVIAAVDAVVGEYGIEPGDFVPLEVEDEGDGE